MFKFIKNKRGIVFGMDARVTLAVTSIMMLVIGYNQVSRFDKNDIMVAESELQVIKDGTEKYYEDKYVVPTINNLLSTQYISLYEGANMDPWGNNYNIGVMTIIESVAGSTMGVKYFYIYSLGKNRTLDITLPTNKAEWLALTEVGDDILVKFSTRTIEEKIAEIENNQLEIVKFLLESYVNTKEKENSDYCAILANQLQPNCDINGNSIYDLKEELQLNYLPKEYNDSDGKYYITTNGTYGTENKFKSGYINTTTNFEYNMYTFMDLIGGYSEYVKSPRGLTLHFSSNMYSNNKSPYFANVWYGDEVTVF